MTKVHLLEGLERIFSGLDLNRSQESKGFDGLNWGQYMSQVRLIHPYAEQIDNTLVLTNQDPTQQHYSLTFSFDQNNRLSSVTLNFAGSQETNNFSTISQAITQRLGTPFSITTFSNTWQRDNTQIKASSLPEQTIIISETV